MKFGAFYRCFFYRQEYQGQETFTVSQPLPSNRGSREATTSPLPLLPWVSACFWGGLSLHCVRSPLRLGGLDCANLSLFPSYIWDLDPNMHLNKNFLPSSPLLYLQTVAVLWHPNRRSVFLQWYAKEWVGQILPLSTQHRFGIKLIPKEITDKEPTTQQFFQRCNRVRTIHLVK